MKETQKISGYVTKVQVSTTWHPEKELIVLNINWKRKANIYWLKLSYILQIKLNHTENMSESYIFKLDYVTLINQDMKYFLFKFMIGGLNNFENSLQNVMNQNSY